jgi:hypothetical protein
MEEPMSAVLTRLAEAFEEWSKFRTTTGCPIEYYTPLGKTDLESFNSQRQKFAAEILELCERAIDELAMLGGIPLALQLASHLQECIDTYRERQNFPNWWTNLPSRIRFAARLQSILPTPTAPPTGRQTSEEEKPKPDGRSKGFPLAEAEVRVRKWLEKHAKDNPAAITRDAVAAATGVSTASVSRTAAWQAFREKRDAEAKPRVREVPLTRGMLSVMKGDDGRDAELDELASLIEEQRADMAEETRYRKFRI